MQYLRNYSRNSRKNKKGILAVATVVFSFVLMVAFLPLHSFAQSLDDSGSGSSDNSGVPDFSQNNPGGSVDLSQPTDQPTQQSSGNTPLDNPSQSGGTNPADGTSPANSNPAVGGTNPTPPSTGGTGNGAATTFPNPLKVSSIQDVLYLIVDIATYVGVILGVLALIWVGFKFIAAQGNSEKLKEARSFFYAVVIGIAILIGANAIVSVVKNTLTSAGVIQPGILGN